MSGQYEPGGHNEQKVAPALENVFSLQGRHADKFVTPVALLKVPEGHGVLVFVSGQ
jgi:hypothetical protein